MHLARALLPRAEDRGEARGPARGQRAVPEGSEVLGEGEVMAARIETVTVTQNVYAYTCDICGAEVAEADVASGHKCHACRRDLCGKCGVLDPFDGDTRRIGPSRYCADCDPFKALRAELAAEDDRHKAACDALEEKARQSGIIKGARDLGWDGRSAH
jgi:hypothetical protein